MNLVKTNSSILRLKEKGFAWKDESGRGSPHGEATVLCDVNGEPLFLRSVIFENGMIGGQLTIIKLSERIKSSKSDFNSGETVFEIRVIRNTSHVTNMIGGGICIKEIDCTNMNVHIFEIGYMYEIGKPISFISSENMQYSETARELLEGVLNKAFMAAIARSLDTNPRKLYYGKLATDVPPLVQKEWKKNKPTVSLPKVNVEDRDIISTPRTKVLV